MYIYMYMWVTAHISILEILLPGIRPLLPKAVFSNSKIAQIRCFLAPAPLGPDPWNWPATLSQTSFQQKNSDLTKNIFLLFLAFEFVTLDV